MHRSLRDREPKLGCAWQGSIIRIVNDSDEHLERLKLAALGHYRVPAHLARACLRTRVAANPTHDAATTKATMERSEEILKMNQAIDKSGPKKMDQNGSTL